MRKSITYSSFAIIGLIIIFVFVSARTYTQLAVASLLYLPAVYFAFRIFVHRSENPQQQVAPPPTPVQVEPIAKVIATANTSPAQAGPVAYTNTTTNTSSEIAVTDIDKRAFLKLIGSVGISFFLFSFLGRRIEGLFSGRFQDPTPGSGSFPSVPITEGYKISEIDDALVSYYGFINNKGGWFIMKEDPDSGSFRYAKGDSNFPGNWLNRENLKYDYFHNLF